MLLLYQIINLIIMKTYMNHMIQFMQLIYVYNILNNLIMILMKFFHILVIQILKNENLLLVNQILFLIY